MTTTIRLTPTQVTDSLILWGNSALRTCTELGADNAGIYVEVTTPRLSSGEELLVRLMEWLNGYEAAPSPDDLRAGLDTENYAAAQAALAAGQVAA